MLEKFGNKIFKSLTILLLAVSIAMCIARCRMAAIDPDTAPIKAIKTSWEAVPFVGISV